MDDRELNTLISMATEAERFERDALDADAAPVRRLSIPRFVAVAATITLAGAAAWVWMTVSPRTQPAPIGPIAHGDAAAADPTIVILDSNSQPKLATATNTHGTPAIVPVKNETNPSMLLAVFEGSEFKCDCVVWDEIQIPPGTTLEQMPRTELVNAALKLRCDSASQLKMLVAVQAPRHDLPPDRAAAMLLADCFVDEEAGCGNSPPCIAAEALGCLPPGVSVVAETMFRP